MRRSSITALGLALVVVACGSDDDAPKGPPPDELSYELFPSTRALTEADLAVLTNLEPDGALVFSSEPAGLKNVAPGQILLGGISPTTPHGLLRTVTAVDRSNGLVVRTAAAPLQAAYRKLHVRAQRTVDPFGPNGSPLVSKDVSPLAVRPNFTLVSGAGDAAQTYSVVVFDGDGDTNTTNDQVKVDATFGGGFTYEIAIDIDWGSVTDLPGAVGDCIASLVDIVAGEPPSCKPLDLLPEAKASFRADPFATLDVKVSGAASLSFEKEVEVGTIDLPPFALGPLVFTPAVDVVAKVEGGASARFELEANARADVKSSVVVSSKNSGVPQYNPPTLERFDVDVKPPVLDLHAKAEASVGARLVAPLYGMFGPYATVTGVARVQASPLETPCFKASVGLETELGVRITTPRLPAIGYITLADASTGPLTIVDKEVATGACTIPPDPPMPPGGGPTPTKIAQPSFTPWAKALAGDVDGLPLAAVNVSAAPELVPSIDGRYVMAGAFAQALHKIDGDGNVTWLGRFGEPGGRRNRVLRTVPAPDGGIFALLRPEDTAAFVIAKLGQSGALAWSRSYGLPDTCIPTVSGLFASRGGSVVLGRCQDGRGFVVRVDGKGDVVRARLWSEAGARLTAPTVATTTTEGDLVVAGEVAKPNDLEWTFVARLDGDDRPVATTAFRCPERIIAQPASIIPSQQGGVTVVGTANGLGMVARVRKDGTLGFVRYPNIGVGVPSSLVVSAVAELGTTGMIIGATGENVAESPRNWVVLAGLDSGGSTLWAKRYVVPNSDHLLGFPALRVTDDGGVLVTAIGATPDVQSATAYAMKVFARDGQLGDGQALVSEPAALEDFTCATESRAVAPSLEDIPVTAVTSSIQRL